MQKAFTQNGFRKPRLAFGGELLRGHAKTKRPISSKLPLHLVLRAKQSVLRKYKHAVDTVVREVCRKHGFELYEFANVGNHLHLLLRPTRRWSAFIRELTSRIAWVCRAIGKFWALPPFTRVVLGWRRAFQIVKEYVRLNMAEGEGYFVRKQTASDP